MVNADKMYSRKAYGRVLTTNFIYIKSTSDFYVEIENVAEINQHFYQNDLQLCKDKFKITYIHTHLAYLDV